MITTNTRHETLCRTLPIVTIALIAISGLTFLHIESLTPETARLLNPKEFSAYEWRTTWDQLTAFITTYAVIPARYFSDRYGMSDLVLPLFTGTFLNGGIWPFLANLVYLWVFGVKVEGRIGAWRFLGLYLLCGIAGTAGHLMVNSDSTAPVLGAGGAIAGLLGAYLILYRESGTAFTLRLFYPFHEVPVPASFLVVLWIGLQFFFGTMPIMVAPDQTSSAGWLVAICGFAAGLAFAFPFRKQGQKKPALKLSHSGTPDIWYALYQNKGGLDRDWR